MVDFHFRPRSSGQPDSSYPVLYDKIVIGVGRCLENGFVAFTYDRLLSSEDRSNLERIFLHGDRITGHYEVNVVVLNPDGTTTNYPEGVIDIWVE